MFFVLKRPASLEASLDELAGDHGRDSVERDCLVVAVGDDGDLHAGSEAEAKERDEGFCIDAVFVVAFDSDGRVKGIGLSD